MVINKYYYNPSPIQKAEVAAALRRVKIALRRLRANRAIVDRVFAALPDHQEPLDNPFIDNFSNI